MPENEEENLTPATRLLEKRREMAEVENALAAEKEVMGVVKSYIEKHISKGSICWI
jgi:hypothetical protein